MTDPNATSYTMTGRELEALCQASGRTLKNFAERVGLPAKQVRSLRASKKWNAATISLHALRSIKCAPRPRLKPRGYYPTKNPTFRTCRILAPVLTGAGPAPAVN